MLPWMSTIRCKSSCLARRGNQDHRCGRQTRKAAEEHWTLLCPEQTRKRCQL